MTTATPTSPPAARGRFASSQLLVPVLAAAGCLVLGLLMLSLSGYAVSDILSTIWHKALWRTVPQVRYRTWADALVSATPILLTGLAVAVAFRASVWNIGTQGQLLAGAIAAVAVGVHFDAPAPVIILTLLLAAAACGGLLGVLSAALERYRRVPVVLSTLLLNFVVIFFMRYLLQGPLKGNTAELRTDSILPGAQLWQLAGTNLHAGFFIALGVALALWLVLRFTTFGFRIRAVGENATAARFAGINAPFIALLTMGLSGAIAGLAGAIEIAGNSHELKDADASSGFGFTGIAVALLGRLTPAGTVVAALFFGLLSICVRALKSELGVPEEAARSLQGIIILVMLVVTNPLAISRLRSLIARVARR